MEEGCGCGGSASAAFVCGHVVEGLMAGRRVGFHWTSHDPGNPHLDAWCRACERRRLKVGGEWIGEAVERLDAKVLCAGCYEMARSFHMLEEPGGVRAAVGRWFGS